MKTKEDRARADFYRKNAGHMTGFEVAVEIAGGIVLALIASACVVMLAVM